jgi:tetratricopeptide (TPR) repeat protein
MRINSSRVLAYIAIVLTGVLVLTGCTTPEKRHDKSAAANQWKGARASVMAQMARDQFGSGNFDGARSTLTQAIKLNPKDPELRVLSARTGIEQGDLELAENELRVAQELSPEMAVADYYYGVVMQRWQRMPKALDLYTKASEKAPTEPAYLLARAETLVALDRETEALALLMGSFSRFENSAEVRATAGQVLLRQRKFSEAADMLRQAVMLNSEDEGLRVTLAKALLNAGRHSEATEVLERLVNAPDLRDRADLHNMLGECYMKLEKYRDARACFETASNLQPQNGVYLIGLARASLEAGDIRRAEIAVRKALAMQPTDGQANLLLGYVRMEQEKFPEALAAFRRSVAADSRDTVALCMVGVVLEKLGRRDEAASSYSAALAVKPDDELARTLMGRLGRTALGDAGNQ